MLKNQKGFGVIEIIIAVVILTAIGGVGYFALTQRDESKATSNSTQGKVAIDSNSVKPFITDFYNKYIEASDGSTGSIEKMLGTVKQNSTQKFVDEYQKTVGHDPVLCAQNKITKFTLSDVKLTSSSAATAAMQREGYPGVMTIHVTKDNNNLKIDQIDCPESTQPVASATPASNDREAVLAAVKSYYSASSMDINLMTLNVTKLTASSATVTIKNDEAGVDLVEELQKTNGKWKVVSAQ